MRLSRLELNGFKSFARKTEIRFGDGVTAVIGPNGSGKSNISDAVRWVLGEQSAKVLRGARMEDVIFNGTQTRRALAYCEVTLVFDNTDGKLPLDYAEVAITRRVYRSGASEYLINKTVCRLREIQDLFRDTGVGKDGYSIIGQGKVDEILANRSGDRRAALEEAAGVMRYRVRKEEAERKLENTEKNLERIEDILKELFDRLAPLEAQSASARTYLKLRDELKDLEVNLFLYQYERVNERLASAKDAVEQLTRERALAESGQDDLLEACASLEERMRVLDASLSEQQNKLISMLSGVEAHAGEGRVLAERREHGVGERARIAGEIAQTEARIRELEGTIAGMTQDGAAEAALAQLERDVEAAQTRLDALDADVGAREEALESLKNSIIEAMNRASDYRSSASRLDAMHAALSQRMEALEAETEKRRLETERLQSERENAELVKREKADRLKNATDALNGAIMENRAAQEAYAAARERVQADEQAISSMQSRLRVLEEMQRSREGYFVSVKNVMRDAGSDQRLKHAIVGVVAELIRVPQQFETAVTMALGSALQNIVTPTAEDAKYVIEYLRAHDYGRATLLPMALLSEPRISREERDLLQMDGCFGLASDLVDCDDAVKKALEHLLGRTAIVRDLDAGVALKKRSRGAFHIATLEGDIISTGGSMSGGSLQKRSYSLLGREREIKELGEKLGNAERALLEKKRGLVEKERELTQRDAQIEAFRSEAQNCEIEAAKQLEQLEIIRRDEESGLALAETLAEERAQIQENLDDVERQREEAGRAQSDAERGNELTREDVTKAQTALNELRNERETVSALLTEQKVRRMALVKERDAVFAEQKRLVSEHRELSHHLAELRTGAERNEQTICALEEQLASINASVASEQAASDEEKKAQRAIEEERQKTSDSLAEQRARREELLAASRELAERIHKQELLQSRAEMEKASIQDHIWEEYELTYENALPYRHAFAVGATNARVAEIKNEVRELGEINLASIDEYKAVYERHESLHAQCEDLKKAKADLETLIVELTGTMETVFLEKFEVIQKNFTEVFAELFGGGHAEMRLADKGDILGCEIDIIAQPPGKKLQLLSLLSGGERAFTAIALLFALLKLKPPAFCLLDEIESSLDEANVTRFADYVKHYSSDTQFILITHRKGSMEVCDTLYGVSMEEKGISKVVSARFDESMAQAT